MLGDNIPQACVPEQENKREIENILCVTMSDSTSKKSISSDLYLHSGLLQLYKLQLQVLPSESEKILARILKRDMKNEH